MVWWYRVINIHGSQEPHFATQPRIELVSNHTNDGGQQLVPTIEDVDVFPIRDFLANSVVTGIMVEFLSLSDAAFFAASFRAAQVAIQDFYSIPTRFLKEKKEEENEEEEHIFIRFRTLQDIGRSVHFTCAGCQKHRLQVDFLLRQFEMVKFLAQYQASGVRRKKKLRFLCSKCHSRWSYFYKLTHQLLWKTQPLRQIPLLSIDTSQRQSAVNEVLRKFTELPDRLGTMPMDKFTTLIQSYPDTFHKIRERKKERKKEKRLLGLPLL